MKTVTMTLDIVVHDEDQLIEFASNLYNKAWNRDMKADMDLYDDVNKSVVRSIFEVLVGSAPLPYRYNDAGITIHGYTHDNMIDYPKEDN